MIMELFLGGALLFGIGILSFLYLEGYFSKKKEDIKVGQIWRNEMDFSYMSNPFHRETEEKNWKPDYVIISGVKEGWVKYEYYDYENSSVYYENEIWVRTTKFKQFRKRYTKLVEQ